MAAKRISRYEYLRLFLLFLTFSSRAFIFNCSLCGNVYTSVKMIVFTPRILKDKSLSRPIYKLQRHGFLCIHLPFSKDIAVCMDVERNPGQTLSIHYRDFSLNENHWNSSNYATSTGSYYTSDAGDSFINRHLNTFYNFRYYDHLTVPCAFTGQKFVNFRGSRAGCHVKSKFTNRIWPIKTVESRRAFPAVVKNLHTSVNKNNLVQINITSNQTTDCSSKMAPSPLKLCFFGLLNCRSVCNKYYVVDKDFDIFAITETWLNPGDCDDFVTGSLIPNGYRFLHSAREGRGGGVGLLFKSLLKVKQTSVDYLDTITCFEAMEVEVKVNSQIVLILISIVLHRHLQTIFLSAFS